MRGERPLAATRRALCVWLGLMGLVCGGVAQSQEDPQQQRALERYQQGRDAYRDGKFDEAVEAFQDAYGLKPNAKLLLFIARAYDKKGDSAGEALQYLERYAATSQRASEEVGPQLLEVRRAFAARMVSSARSRVLQARAVASSREPEAKVPTLEDPNVGNPVFNDVPYAVRTQPPGARVYVDDREWGVQAETPDTFPLFPGAYKLIVEKEFYDTVELNVVIEGLDKNKRPQFTELALVRQQVAVTVKARPTSARIVYVGDDGVSRDLGSGKWEGELPAGPAKFVVRSSTQGERTFEEVLLLSQRDETGRQRLELDLRREGDVAPDEKITGTLVVKSYLLGGEVYVDGRKIGDTPGSVEASVAPGGHTVELRKAGYRPWEASLRIDRGEREEVQAPEELELLPDEGISWGGWLFTSVGVAAAGAGGFLTFQGITQQSDADALVRPNSEDNGADAIRRREEIASLEEDADKSHLLSYICYGVGGASLLGGILFFALDGGEPVASGEEGEARWRFGALPLPDGGGVWLDLRWR
jgi:hypothetical protein